MSSLLTARDLEMLVATAAPVLALVGVAVTLYRPRTALLSCCILFLLAGTKFRTRDAQALIGGDIDRQVMYELVLFAVVAVIALRAALRFRPSSFRPLLMELLLAGYVSMALLSMLWATHLNITAVRSVQLAILFMFSVIAVRVLSPKDLLRALMVSVVVYVLGLSCLVLLFPSFAAGRHWLVQPARFSWFGAHPLMVATYAGSALILLLAFTLFRSDDRKSYRHGLIWLVNVVLGIIVLATRSRAALLATASAVLVLLVRKYVIGPGAVRSKLSLTFVLLWTGLVFGLVVDQLARPDPTQSRLGHFFMRGQSVEVLRTLNSRDLIWQEVVVLFMQQPIVGHGYVGSRVLLLEKIPWAGDGHFALAESLMNVGGLGTALIFIPMLYLLIAGSYLLLRTGNPDLKYRAAVVSGAVFILLNSMSTPGFAGPPSYEVLLFFALALVSEHLDMPAARCVSASAHQSTTPSTPHAEGRRDARLKARCV